MRPASMKTMWMMVKKEEKKQETAWETERSTWMQQEKQPVTLL